MLSTLRARILVIIIVSFSAVVAHLWIGPLEDLDPPIEQEIDIPESHSPPEVDYIVISDDEEDREEAINPNSDTDSLFGDAMPMPAGNNDDEDHVAEVLAHSYMGPTEPHPFLQAMLEKSVWKPPSNIPATFRKPGSLTLNLQETSQSRMKRKRASDLWEDNARRSKISRISGNPKASLLTAEKGRLVVVDHRGFSTPLARLPPSIVKPIQVAPKRRPVTMIDVDDLPDYEDLEETEEISPAVPSLR